MNPTDIDDKRARGRALREARRARTQTIRRRVIAGALSMFVATWLLIAIVLVSGHDPALASRKASSASAAAQTRAAVQTTTAAQGSTTAQTTTAAQTTTGGTSGSGTVSGVTTRQS